MQQCTDRLSFVLALAVVVNIAHVGQADQASEVYRSEIRSLFKSRCYACHGALKQESDLRLDTVLAMKEHGILESGDLLDRLTSAVDGHRMPPEGEPLTVEELQRIKTWITAGAPAPEDEEPESDPLDHWAFQKILRPELPLGSEEANPIDSFIEEKLRKNGLQPQPVARRTLLLRRLYLDVVGLPPTIEQLRSEQPIDDLITSLLNNPQYGERWGRHWMDVWRYSDWYGLGGMLRNSQRHLWHWRDWIVDSLNHDKGYDRMITEMLAGDEIAPLEQDVVTATGFLARNYYLFNRTTWLDDTIEHTSKALIGLTMNCAKCHDHKYDPVSQEDYYRFRAIFEPHHVRLDATPVTSDFAKDGLPRVYDDKPGALTYVHRRGNPADPIKENPVLPGPPIALASFAPEPAAIDLPLEAWAPGTRDYFRESKLAAATTKVVKARQNYRKLARESDSHNISQSAPAQTEHSDFVLTDDFNSPRPDDWETVGKGWHYRAGVLMQTDPSTQRSQLRARVDHPQDFDATFRFRITGGDRWRSVGIQFDADADGGNSNFVYVSAVSGGSKVQLAHNVAGKSIYPPDAKVDRQIELSKDYSLNLRVRDDLINVSLNDQFLFAYHLPKRITDRAGKHFELFTFSATADFHSIELRPISGDVVLQDPDSPPAVADAAKTLELAAAELKLAELELFELKTRIAVDDANLKDKGEASAEAAGRARLEVRLAQAEVDVLKAEKDKRPAAVKLRDQIEKELAAGKLPAHSPLRGSQRALDQKTHKESQYSAIYPRTSTGRRSALASWITDRNNPLTARVAINHIWARHFGTPLVETVFDFGRRAPKPLHQNLLDYLAVELIESGWSMKHIHRLILTSKTWQRTSSNLNADPDTVSFDAENRFYWRMNHRRMESQLVRDSLLKLSGTIDLTRGGPPVKPTPQVRRRSLYLIHSRDDRDRFVATFDDADIFACYRRSESVVPQQALAMMNSRIAIESAKMIAETVEKNIGDGDFADRAFFLLLCRTPSDAEANACREFLDTNLVRDQYIHALLNHNDFLVIR